MTIAPLTAFVLLTLSENCAVTVALVPVSVIAPPALEPLCASAPFAVPLPAVASVIVPV
jgi:hypothetical protein